MAQFDGLSIFAERVFSCLAIFGLTEPPELLQLGALTVTRVEQASGNPEVLELHVQFQTEIDPDTAAWLDKFAHKIWRKTGKRPAVNPQLDHPRIHWYMVIEQGVNAGQIKEAMLRGERLLAERGVEFERGPSSETTRVF